MAALIAWMLAVRVDDFVKDGAISAVTRVFDALWRRRLRRSSILDKIINANNQHPSDQGRHVLRVKCNLPSDSLLPHFPAKRRAAPLRISSNNRRARSHGCGGGYGDQFRSCWRYSSA